MEEQSKNKKKGKVSLIVLASVSFLVMLTAVIMIFIYTRQYKPEVLHTNDQTMQTEDGEGFLNEDSPQKLEHDASKIAVEPLKNSQIYIIAGGTLMTVMVIAFIFVKVKESKEDN